MRYDFSNIFDCQKARVYLEKLISDKEKAELTKKNKKRTLSQNALFHVWVAVFAEFSGYESKDECKIQIKRKILGQYPKFNRLTGNEEMMDYETHLMDTKQLSDFMDKFKIWANVEFGCYLPYFGDAGYEEMVQKYN